MLRHLSIGIVTLVLIAAMPHAVAADQTKRPNVIIILADDMGIGDISGLNPEGKIPTPHIDELIKGGIAFTSGHSSSSVCTPTRYSLLTGRYSWRGWKKSGVSGGSSPPVIEEGRPTLASVFKQAGYTTAMVGKWHLGLSWQSRTPDALKQADPQAFELFEKAKKQPGKDQFLIDYTKPFAGGPTDHGFDTFYGIAASLDMPPYVWLEGKKATVIPTEFKGWNRPGPTQAGFHPDQVLGVLGDRSAGFIAENAKANKPFFLYVPLTSPHTPIVPSAAWQGKNELLGRYGDFMMETDDVVGKIVKALKANDALDNTIVIFTADNGASPAAGFPKLIAKGHYPNGPLRGHKGDLYEGGHRVPFVLHWPDGAPSGHKTNHLVSQVDFMRTFANMVGVTLPDQAGEDSFDMMPLIQGKDVVVRESHIAHTLRGQLAITSGRWKLIPNRGTGWTPVGRRYRGHQVENPETDHIAMLFDMQVDENEYHNLIDEKPDIAKQLAQQLINDIKAGRTAPGGSSPNTPEVEIFSDRGAIIGKSAQELLGLEE